MAGGGNDLVVVTIDADGDVYNGGDGSDVLDMSNASSGVNVDLVSGTISNAEIGTDIISGFEKIIGGSGTTRSWLEISQRFWLAREVTTRSPLPWEPRAASKPAS